MTGGVYTKTSKTQGSSSMVIHASAKELWPLISDPTQMGKFSPENAGAFWRDGATKPAVGVRFRGINRRGPAMWFTESVIRTCKINSEFSFDVSFPVVMPDIAKWTWTLEPANSDPDATKVTVSWKLPKPIGKTRRLFWNTMGVGDREKDLAKGTSKTLRELAAYVEGAHK